MRSSLISLEFRRRRESLFGNIKNKKVSASVQPGSRGGGKSLPPSREPPRLATNSPLRILTRSLQYISTASGRPRRSLPHARTHTHAHAHARRSHARRPNTRGVRKTPRTSSPIHIFPCSGFSFNMQVFPRGRGRGGGWGVRRYDGGDMMRRKQYGKNKYFWSVNLTCFSSLKFR